MDVAGYFPRTAPGSTGRRLAVCSTNDAFLDEIEAILDRIIPIYIPGKRLLIVNASDVTESFDQWAVAVGAARSREPIPYTPC
jgi:hypothetical protein